MQRHGKAAAAAAQRLSEDFGYRAADEVETIDAPRHVTVRALR